VLLLLFVFDAARSISSSIAQSTSISDMGGDSFRVGVVWRRVGESAIEDVKLVFDGPAVEVLEK
jgi:hypothetical protein